MAIMLIRRWITRLLLLLATVVVVASCARGPGPGPVILPPPDLRQPADAMTRLRVQALVDNPQLCRIVLQEADVAHRMLPGRTLDAAGCGFPAAVRRAPAHGVNWAPDPPATGCAVAAALHMWERDVLQPAASRHLGYSVTSIRHFGSYSCRTIGGGPEGRISEHARANAIDIAGFRLANGREISLIRDWQAEDPATRAFLRAIRDGACRHFSTVLSPDYNAAHADHFHFDQARRGAFGFCR